MEGFGSGSCSVCQQPPPFRPLSRRSGRVPAMPYPPLSRSQSGSTSTCRTMTFQRTAPTPLTRCLTPGVQFRAMLATRLAGRVVVAERLAVHPRNAYCPLRAKPNWTQRRSTDFISPYMLMYSRAIWLGLLPSNMLPSLSLCLSIVKNLSSQ